MASMNTSGPGLANPQDVESLDAIISAAYDVISGPAGEARNWERLQSLFAPGARLIPTSKEAGVTLSDGEMPEALDVESYILRVSNYFEVNGFVETEVARTTEQFGRIAHAFSTYESRHHRDDPEPFMRGINSIQLFHDGKRWWIVTIYWQHEHAGSVIPQGYLAKP
jgi:hypothetical protein